MKQEKQQAIALMRYGAIAPLIAGLDEDYPSKTAFYMELSTKGLVGPDGRVHHYAPSTIEKWYLDYQNHGFDALIPKGRSDAGMSRKLDDELQERIRYFKTNYPRMSAAAIYRQLKNDGSIINGQVSESTVCRFVNQLQIELRQTPNRDMRRYERPHINEVWCGDSSVGPHLTDADGKKHRIYIIALIDDASRFITGIDVFYNDNFINLMSVMKSAVSKYGRPKVLNFDNGKSYKNKQMELLAARIGTTLSYCQPYTPTSKAKIERWFRTLKDQWMAALICVISARWMNCAEACMLMCKAITWHLILPCAACHHRIVSSLSQIISAVLHRIISTKTSFWRLNGVFRQTVSSSLTRSNMKWTAGSHASGSGSGKSTFTNRIKAYFGDDVAVLYHDNYYRCQDGVPFEQRVTVNYDHPDSLETDLLIEHLKELKAGRSIDSPVYDYSQHNRSHETVRIAPKPIIIVEGILFLADERLRSLLDIKVYVEADSDERILRRISRDVSERGRDLNGIIEQYLTTVKPMHYLYVEPTRSKADVVINSGKNDVEFDLFVSKIGQLLEEREKEN